MIQGVFILGKKIKNIFDFLFSTFFFFYRFSFFFCFLSSFPKRWLESSQGCGALVQGSHLRHRMTHLNFGRNQMGESGTET
jgi:hypothetical protein